MPALIELYLKDYYELCEADSLGSKLLSLIDLDMAMFALKESFTREQWLILHLFCMGYSYREIAEMRQTGFRKVRNAQRRICRALERHLGWEYSDAKVHTLVAKKLKVVRLTDEEHKFVQLKLNNHGNFMFSKFTIYNFAFDVFGRVVLRR